MNLKTNLLEEYIIFVDTTKKQNAYLTRITILFVVILSLFLIFFYLNILMNNNFSLHQISGTGSLDSSLISRQYKVNLMAYFLRNKY